LQSRYYNPEWGRFLNADGLVSTGQGFIGYNMFAYCLNSPVNRRDDNGLRSGCITEGASGGSYTSTPSNSGEVERAYFSIPNLMGSIAGTVLGAVENVTRTCKAYLVGQFITGPLVAAGMAAGPIPGTLSVIGALGIDYVAGTAINYGQNILYRKFGLE